MGAFFDTPGKYAAALLACAGLFAFLAIFALRRGEVRVRGGSVRRADSPALFAFVVTFLLVVSGVCVLAGWVVLVGEITPGG
ncbi:MAG: hypothetical protein L0H23_09675 [Luteimonas sp.]|nr:hypothetical protein [Luteimonas sp.]